MNNKWRYPKDQTLRFEEKNKELVLESIKKENVVLLSRKKPRIFRKTLYGIITAACLILLIITSTYVSPAMAKVVANIPYFRLFIEQKEYRQDLNNVIFDVVQEKGLEIYHGIDVSVPTRELILTLIGTKEHVDQLRPEVIKDINAKLIAENFGKFDITVKRVGLKEVRGNNGTDLTPEEKEYERQWSELQPKVEEYLKNNKYVTPFPPSVTINKNQRYIYVSIAKTEKREAELEQAMLELSKPYGDFVLDIRKSDMTAREQELRWENNDIIGILASGLMENKEFKVRGFSYSFHPLPLLIEVRVSLKSTDPKAKKLEERIQREINTFIKTDELTKNVRNDPYVVTVIGKDEKKITKNKAPRL
ncbi:DUF4030 domain-containing protein [Gottfriedia acidiceleris]|uniref:DUF4030 domain-containing protein n=1 Tax=Gottfriedia acidiceleris TaxID=371036 RepID=UPI003000C8BC